MYFSIFLALLLSICSLGKANPFAIDYPETEQLTWEDYNRLQNQLRQIQLRPFLETLYVNEGTTATFEDFLARCSRGIKQTLITNDKNLIPSSKLVRIGKGGNRCIVSCVPYNPLYSHLLLTIPTALQATGFNGYFLYQIGGFPNPTGIEIKYAAVPYSFKIFMMREANKLGFDNVLWIDSAALPIKNPNPLFDWIEKTGALIHGYHPNPNLKNYILPATRQELQKLTGTDVLNSTYVCTIVFGLKFGTPETQKLLEDYYAFAELGTPFLSCFPEEFVLTAIKGQKTFDSWKAHPFNKLFRSGAPSEDPLAQKKALQEEGYFFFHSKKR